MSLRIPAKPGARFLYALVPEPAEEPPSRPEVRANDALSFRFRGDLGLLRRSALGQLDMRILLASQQPRAAGWGCIVLARGLFASLALHETAKPAPRPDAMDAVRRLRRLAAPPRDGEKSESWGAHRADDSL